MSLVPTKRRKSGELYVKGPGWADCKARLGPSGRAFLAHCLGTFERVMPHVEARKWTISADSANTGVSWNGTRRRAISVKIGLVLGNRQFLLQSEVVRKSAPEGVGSREWTLDMREKDLCGEVARRVFSLLQEDRSGTRGESLRAIQSQFDEDVVAAHLKRFQGLQADVGGILAALRGLAEQSYENKTLSYGVVVGAKGPSRSEQEDPIFPAEFLGKKRYRALSDGYRTAYFLNRGGAVVGLRDLESESRPSGSHFFPEPFRHLAGASFGNRCGIGLTRQGEILVFAGGTLRFTYRVGRWQYWNHTHVCNLFESRARVQHVSRSVLPRVTRTIYRLALDVSFRRSGALFVLLRNQKKVRSLVVAGDGIGNARREALHAIFDRTLGAGDLVSLPRSVATELAGLDGGMVLSNKGRILAYAAVLKTSGRFSPSEGSRTKAAISAARVGIAIKVSSDGDISFYEGKGSRPFLEL